MEKSRIRDKHPGSATLSNINWKVDAGSGEQSFRILKHWLIGHNGVLTHWRYCTLGLKTRRGEACADRRAGVPHLPHILPDQQCAAEPPVPPPQTPHLCLTPVSCSRVAKESSVCTTTGNWWRNRTLMLLSSYKKYMYMAVLYPCIILYSAVQSLVRYSTYFSKIQRSGSFETSPMPDPVSSCSRCQR
jgi:hypothetical protein